MTARRARPVAGRAGWGLIDQAFSSLTNFALGILIARTVPIAEFGAFSLAVRRISHRRQHDQGVPDAAPRDQVQHGTGRCVAEGDSGGARDCDAGGRRRGRRVRAAGSGRPWRDRPGFRRPWFDVARASSPGRVAIRVLRRWQRVEGLSERLCLGVHAVSSARPHRGHRVWDGLLADIRVGLCGDDRRSRRGSPIRGPTTAAHDHFVVARAPRPRATFSDRGGRRHRRQSDRLVRRRHRGRTRSRRGHAGGAPAVRTAPDPIDRARPDGRPRGRSGDESVAEALGTGGARPLLRARRRRRRLVRLASPDSGVVRALASGNPPGMRSFLCSFHSA